MWRVGIFKMALNSPRACCNRPPVSENLNDAPLAQRELITGIAFVARHRLAFPRSISMRLWRARIDGLPRVFLDLAHQHGGDPVICRRDVVFFAGVFVVGVVPHPPQRIDARLGGVKDRAIVVDVTQP
jgi:hypothetical protein